MFVYVTIPFRRFAHFLFWNLKVDIASAEYGRRSKTLLEGLLSSCGDGTRQQLAWEVQLVRSLTDIAQSVRQAGHADRTVQREFIWVWVRVNVRKRERERECVCVCVCMCVCVCAKVEKSYFSKVYFK